MEKEMEIRIFKPRISEPTDEEAKVASEDFKAKFNKELSKDDSVKFAVLRNELGYWLSVEKEYEKSGISKEMAKEAQEFIEKKRGQEISLKQAYLEAEKSLLTTIMSEKERIDKEIRILIHECE